jgi:hypothetical protein
MTSCCTCQHRPIFYSDNVNTETEDIHCYRKLTSELGTLSEVRNQNVIHKRYETIGRRSVTGMGIGDA